MTAAGYPERHGTEYARRLVGLLEAVAQSQLSESQKNNLAILGGECNYLFKFNGSTSQLEWVEESLWRLDEMHTWEEKDIKILLDLAQTSLEDCAASLRLNVQIIRKPRAVGSTLLAILMQD